jgi:DNA-binding phage protein
MAQASAVLHGFTESQNAPEEIAAYLDACIEKEWADAHFIAKALGVTTRTHGET